MPVFADRRDAGKKLAQKLLKYKDKEDVVVLALPRGGVPVAFEVAKELNAPLDIFIVRKLGVPGQEELAMGAIASGGIRVLNEDVINTLKITDDAIARTAAVEQQELERRERLYKDEVHHIDVENKIVILIDDGLATGASMRAGVMALRGSKPDKIIVAVPTASPETCEEFQEYVEEIICAHTPEMFKGVGQWYNNFSQTTDDEVKELLHEFHKA